MIVTINMIDDKNLSLICFNFKKQPMYSGLLFLITIFLFSNCGFPNNI